MGVRAAIVHVLTRWTLSTMWESGIFVIRFYLEEKLINIHILYLNRNDTYIIYEHNNNII